MTEAITVTEAGPIEGEFPIEITRDGKWLYGVHVFRGMRGVGKSTLLTSIDGWVSGHRVDVTLHDGALSGSIEGLGRKVPIGGRKRAKGELEVDFGVIDSEKCSLADLISPPQKTPETRDAHAIRAIATLSGIKSDPSIYYELAGGQQSLDGLGIQDTDDPVLLAKRVKEAYDKTVREKTRTAEAEIGHAKPLEAVPGGLDISLSSDLEALGTERDKARDAHKTLTVDRTSGLAKEHKSIAATTQLDKVRAEYDGPTLKDTKEDEETTQGVWNKAEDLVERLEKELAAAKAEEREKWHEHQAATQRSETAKQHAEAVSALEATARQEVSYPAPEEIVKAQTEVAAATQAYDDGIRVRDCKQNQAKAKTHREAAKQAEKEAATAKAKSSEVFDLLAQSLHTEHLSIKSVDGNPRLFVDHPKRGRTAFDKTNGLSDGERIHFALLELLPHIKSPGMLVIPQSAWQGHPARRPSQLAPPWGREETDFLRCGDRRWSFAVRLDGGRDQGGFR